MTVIKQQDFIQSIADGFQFIASYHPTDFIKEMGEAHSGEANSLRAKVLSGKGTAEDAKKLLALYEDLGKNDPPKGEKAAWKKKCDAIVVAAMKVVGAPDDKASLTALTKATNCGLSPSAPRTRPAPSATPLWAR